MTRHGSGHQSGRLGRPRSTRLPDAASWARWLAAARSSLPSSTRTPSPAGSVPTFEWQALFDREWRALSAVQQRAFREAVAAFVDDLREGTGFRKSLRVKKMQGREDVREITWAPDGRATFHFGTPAPEGQPHSAGPRIGPHKISPRPCPFHQQRELRASDRACQTLGRAPRGPRSGADRDLRVVTAQSPARCGSLMAAERRLVVLGGRLVILVVNDH